MVRKLVQQKGQALLMALAFMVLAIPVVTSTLSLASTLTLDSRSRAQLLETQYSALGAKAVGNYLLHTTSTTGTTTQPVTINGDTVTTTIVRLLDPPDAVPVTSRKGRKLTVTKTVTPTSVSAAETVTYTITIQNRHKQEQSLTKILDELPTGFAYVPGSTSLKDNGGSTISTDDPTITSQQLAWVTPSGTTLGIDESATVTFDATAASSLGVYCNEAWAEKGGKKTRSGKTAKVTVGSPSETQCEGMAASVAKSVTPDVVHSNTSTAYTYTITITNEGTDDLDIKRITDTIGTDDLSYDNNTVSSTPLIMDPGNPQTKTQGGELELRWNFSGSGEALTSGTTWQIQYTTTGTLDRGYYGSEVEIEFGANQLPDQTTGVEAIILVVDLYRITVETLERTYTCDIWMTTDTEIEEDIQVTEGCAFNSPSDLPVLTPTPTP